MSSKKGVIESGENQKRVSELQKKTVHAYFDLLKVREGIFNESHSPTPDMLQSLLQPRDNQRSKMIGAMPAVAVRHERRRGEKRGGGRRPSQLQLQLGRTGEGDPTPSPDHHRLRNELYVCGKVAALHAVVGSLLLGIVVLVVGLVQLSPGAEAAQHRYYLMGAGGALVGAGVIGAVLRCICLHWYNRKFREEAEEHEQQMHHKNGVSTVESGHAHKSDHEHKPKLKSQGSRDVDHQQTSALVKQPSAASDT